MIIVINRSAVDGVLMRLKYIIIHKTADWAWIIAHPQLIPQLMLDIHIWLSQKMLTICLQGDYAATLKRSKNGGKNLAYLWKYEIGAFKIYAVDMIKG